MLGQVEECVLQPPVLVPSEEEEGCEVCGGGKAELLLGTHLSPCREWHRAQSCSATRLQSLALTANASGLGILSRSWAWGA